MSIEIQEPEMIQRYGDSLSRAASHAKEFMTVEEVRKPTLFVEFIAELKVAAGSAHQLAIYQENPNWLSVRDTIEGVIDIGQTTPIFTSAQAGQWLVIKQSLERMAENGLRMARAKSLSRAEVLGKLLIRESVARTNVSN